ncbi:hypothetical protein M409DRAFT_53442 [Zasmidium cellare ATCC 36951]|uniref:Uncharacterized protein n=1 Tax=Zasmidium cellare ATCC 36951 TaxID=1080233 RepID=A0A6A6CPH1_ZASCE|nr:uncharacterized protein M409DRAFT_53442 [Zasmidium cellare ATCC 36951]KAF2168128.1 hypothetical protein M409DRAFT_53442 [Zasmidium cellare ATCC 36951]
MSWPRARLAASVVQRIGTARLCGEQRARETTSYTTCLLQTYTFGHAPEIVTRLAACGPSAAQPAATPKAAFSHLSHHHSLFSPHPTPDSDDDYGWTVPARLRLRLSSAAASIRICYSKSR